MISDLGYGDQLGDDPDALDDEGEDAEARRTIRTTNPIQHRRGRQQEERPKPTPSSSQEEQQDAAQAQVSMDDMRRHGGDATSAEMPEGEAPLEPPPPPPVPRPIPITVVYSSDTTRRSPPRTWPSRPSWNACAPISTSSSNR
jgi:cobaltochelatase CobT